MEQLGDEDRTEALSLSLFFFFYMSHCLVGHTQSQNYSLSTATLPNFTRMYRGKPESPFFSVQLKSSVRLDEQGREGKRQENDPSNDCNCGSKNKERGTLIMGWITRQTTHVYVICFTDVGKFKQEPSSDRKLVTRQCRFRMLLGKAAAAWNGPPRLASCQLLVLEGNKRLPLQQPITPRQLV